VAPPLALQVLRELLVQQALQVLQELLELQVLQELLDLQELLAQALRVQQNQALELQMALLESQNQPQGQTLPQGPLLLLAKYLALLQMLHQV
jgi:hypothetical protein